MKFHLPPPGRRLRRILTLLGQAALCCVLTAARLGGLYAPFSLAAAAAAGPGLPGLLSLLGVTGGALLFLDFQPGLRHAAAAVLLFAAQTAFCDTKFYRRPAFRPLTAALSQLLIQSVYLLYRPLSQWVLCLTASALLAAATALLTAHGTTLRQKGLLYAAALSLALVPVTVEGLFSVGKALLMAELLLLSRRLPPLTVGLAGACAGLAADLVPETPALLLTVAYGCGGALAAFYGRLPRILPAAAFSLPIMTLAVLLDAGPPRQLLLSCLAGGAAYLLLPRRWLPPCAERAARADAPGETAKPRRLEQSAAALRSLYDSFFRDTAPAPPENPSVIFDRAAEQVCRSCVLCAICWQQNYNATYNAFNDACPALLRRGTAQPEDFPLYFTARCVHLREFVAAVNGELRLFLLRRQYHRQLTCSRRQAQEQYAQMGDLLAAAAHAPAEEPTGPVGYRVSSALRPKEGQQLCGDQLATVETGGMLYLLLSDGMGSGPEAHREAALTVRLLEQFLRAGIEAAPALKTLNSALALRGETGGAFTTIDLLALRRSTGEATLYKYGAAPSYLKHTAHVTRFTLPAGLQATTEPPEVTRLALPAGSYFVMISDGIADENSDEWLQNLLVGWNGTDVHALTALILSESRSRRGLEDDCAVLAVHLPLPGENHPRQV